MKGEMAQLRCAGIQRFVDTYLDGEFAEPDRMEFEAHLTECEPCRRSVRGQAEWKAAIKKAAPREVAPAALRNRVLRALHKEEPRRSWRRFYSRALPAAAAAGLLCTFALSRVQWSPVAADVIAKHQRNLPMEVSGGNDQVKRWYADKVDFPVRVPNFGQVAALRGGRLANVRERQAAYLVYDYNGNRVSVFEFDPGEMALSASQKQVIGNREYYFDAERGYNVVLYRENGVGYAIASDLDRDQMMKLVSASVAP